MKLTQLAAKPQLIKVELSDEDVVKEFGEPLEFWIWDRQPIDTFIKLAQMKEDNTHDLVTMIQTMILDETGQKIITEENILPTRILSKVVMKVVETLGK